MTLEAWIIVAVIVAVLLLFAYVHFRPGGTPVVAWGCIAMAVIVLVGATVSTPDISSAQNRTDHTIGAR